MHKPESTSFVSPVKINSGRKALAHIPFELAALGAERPLLITTEIHGKRPVRRVTDALRDSGVTLGIYDGIGERPQMKTVLHLARLFQDGGFDAIIALGSGSVMHVAKALNLAVVENAQDLTPFAEKGDRRIRRLNPCMAIPAGMGDGYETTSTALVEGMVFSSVNLIPDIVVVDPVVFETEAPLTVISGAMIALTHAMEGVAGPRKNPFVDAYAHTAIRMIIHHIADAVDGRRWRQARAGLAGAEVMAGCAFSNVNPGLTHLLGEVIGQRCAFSDGLCMGILLPYVLDYLSAREDFFVGGLLLPVAGPETFALTAGDLRSGKMLTFLQELQFSLYEATHGKLPMTLEDLGIKEDQLKSMALEASQRSSTPCHENGYFLILEHAFRGDSIGLN